jgi:hypothetical protein
MCPPDTLEFFTVALMKCLPTHPFCGGRIPLDNVLSIYTTIFLLVLYKIIKQVAHWVTALPIMVHCLNQQQQLTYKMFHENELTISHYHLGW